MASTRGKLRGRSISLACVVVLCFSLCGLSTRAQAEAPLVSNAAKAEAKAPYGAWRGTQPHAPPPLIALGAPPPPELEPPEYTRRPVELTAEVLFGLSNCSAGTNDARCSGLEAGAGVGLSALFRLSPYFAVAGTFNALGFAFHPSTETRLRDSSASGRFYGLLGRVYFTDRGSMEPYVELGLGRGSAGTAAREANAAIYSETSAGTAVRAGVGVEFYIGGRLRLGPALSWTRFWSDDVQRCDAAEVCTSIAASAVGHGVGFSSLSARATILLGPGL